MRNIDRTLRFGVTMLAARLAAGRPDLMTIRRGEETTPSLRRVVVAILATLGRSE
jgi:hypothetical protein